MTFPRTLHTLLILLCLTGCSSEPDPEDMAPSGQEDMALMDMTLRDEGADLEVLDMPDVPDQADMMEVDASPDMAPPEEDLGPPGHQEVMGAVDAPESCAQVCQTNATRCDGEYEHFMFGKVALVATYEQDTFLGSSDCDEVPRVTVTDFTGETKNLVSYTCYCID